MLFFYFFVQRFGPIIGRLAPILASATASSFPASLHGIHLNLRSLQTPLHSPTRPDVGLYAEVTVEQVWILSFFAKTSLAAFAIVITSVWKSRPYTHYEIEKLQFKLKLDYIPFIPVSKSKICGMESLFISIS